VDWAGGSAAADVGSAVGWQPVNNNKQTNKKVRTRDGVKYFVIIDIQFLALYGLIVVFIF
jgi:hypothetical protein